MTKLQIAHPVMEESHEAILKRALKLEDNANLPETVVDLYWDFERTARRIGHRLDVNALVLIAVLSGNPTSSDPVSFVDVINGKGVNVTDRVLAKFRDQWQWGRFQGYGSGWVLVQLDDETAEVREFRPTQVRLPTPEEKQKIGE